MPSLGITVCDWIADVLPSPDDATQPFVVSDPQARFLLRWFEVDERGRFVHRRALLQEAKGWGKSPLIAALALFELAGPARFDGFGADGRPVGRPWGTSGDAAPYVQLVGVSEDSSRMNIYSACIDMLTANNGRAAQTLNLDVGLTRIRLKDRSGKLESVTSSAQAREGARTTFVALDETSLWNRGNHGVALAATVRRNLGKLAGRSVECSNSHVVGAGSVAEATAQAAERGEPGLLVYAHRPDPVPTPQATDDELLVALRQVYAGCTWMDLERIVDEIRDPSTDWSTACRMFLNTPMAAHGTIVDPGRWSELIDDVDHREDHRDDRVALGLAGDARSGAALVACTTTDPPVLSVLGAWERPEDALDWRTPHTEIDEAVSEAFDTLDVVRFHVDSLEFGSDGDAWADRFGSDVVLAFDTRSSARMGDATARFRTAVEQGNVRHDGSSILSRHLSNARVKIGAKDRPLLERAGTGSIAAAQAAVLAHEAAANAPEPARFAFALVDAGGHITWSTPPADEGVAVG